jgi:hypothetical protein
MAGAFETKKALIVVRTYPTPATKGIEVSCTAAITDHGEWLRLFPIPYRFLDADKRFKKYQWVQVSVSKPSRDPRPESYKIENNAITIISDVPPDDGWKERKRLIMPLKAHCMCCLQKTRDEKGFPTLGIFRPKKIERLIIEDDDPAWSDEQLELLKQGTLFSKEPKAELEKVPFKFRYVFKCDHDGCSGHRMICTDWEMGESWRRWKDTYGEGWRERFSLRYEKEMIDKFDTHFYVGTVHGNPKSWIIVGLFYPPRPAETPLLNGL